VTAPAHTFAIPDGPLTVEAWIAPAPDGLTGIVAGNFDFLLYVLGGRPVFGLDIEKSAFWAASQEDPITAEKWHHLAGVFDGEKVRLFVDGRQVATKKASGNQPRSGVDLHIGAQCDLNGRRSAFFRGRIDELRISKIARYTEEGFVPARRHEPDADTVVLFHLDAAMGPFTPDHSGSAAHGCRRGNVSYVSLEKKETPKPE
jgi:hypothetical protein